jgi:hypothetical protein
MKTILPSLLTELLNNEIIKEEPPLLTFILNLETINDAESFNEENINKTIQKINEIEIVKSFNLTLFYNNPKLYTYEIMIYGNYEGRLGSYYDFNSSLFKIKNEKPIEELNINERKIKLSKHIDYLLSQKRNLKQIIETIINHDINFIKL